MRHAYRVPERGVAAPVPVLPENGATAAVPRDAGRSFVPAAGKARRFRRFWGLLGLLALLLAEPMHATGASLPEQTDGGQWFVSIQENAPVYPNLEAARNNAPTDLNLSPPQQDDAFRVLERREGWARIVQHHGDGGRTEGWISADALLPLADYLLDPAYRDAVLCPAESPDYTEALNPATLAAGVPLALDPARKDARLYMRLAPTLRGGGGILEVRGPDGTLLWSSPGMGPKIVDRPPDGAFYCGPMGFRWPQQVGDMDGDGRAELLVHHPQTEMGPGTYTLLRWTGSAFEPLLSARQLIQPGSPDSPIWKLRPLGDEEAELPSAVSWVDGWPAIQEDGTLIGHVEHSAPQGDGTLRWSSGTARFRLRPDTGEAVFLGWITPLSPDAD